MHRDGLGGLSTRHPELDAGVDLVAEGQRFFRETEESASEVVLRILREQPPRSVTYAALGPLTTLASVMKYDASTFRQVIGRVVCMGGMSYGGSLIKRALNKLQALSMSLATQPRWLNVRGQHVFRSSNPA